VRIIEARLLHGTHVIGLARGYNVARALHELADHPVTGNLAVTAAPQQLTVQFTPREVPSDFLMGPIT
jgi:hypothetical protein